MGLSASVFTTIYAISLQPFSITFILVIAAALPLLCIIAFPFFNAVPFRQKGEFRLEGQFWSNSKPSPPVFDVVQKYCDG